MLRLDVLITCAVLTASTWSRSSRACDGSVPALSEARAARWLIGDEMRLQAMLDQDRERLQQASRLSARQQPYQLFAAAHGAYQHVFGIDVCSSRGSQSGSLARPRGAGTVGFTHTESGLHARLSFLYANDVVAAPGFAIRREDELESSDARAGYRQGLIALRLGHAQIFQTLCGYVGAEQPYRREGSGGVRLTPRLPSSPSPGFFFGGSIPMLHTSVVTLLQGGKPEVIALAAQELRPGRLPFTISLGPTYLREERQVIGMLRLRGFSLERHQDAHETYAMSVNEKKQRRVQGIGEAHETTGPVLELSAESRQPRLRHARIRWQYTQAWRFASRESWLQRSAFDIALYADGTLFRSRAFSESLEDVPPSPLAGRGTPRGNAWGFGAGCMASVQAGWLALSADVTTGMNRPELLQLIPSAAHRAELQIGGAVRVEY